MREKELFNDAVSLLKELIAVPSFSKEEAGTAKVIENYFLQMGIEVNRSKNNIWVANKYFDSTRPSILLNSHHDTVKPNGGYTNDPFEAAITEDKLYGLGSTDAGGSLVSLLAAFLYFYESKELSYNLIFAATAEEEISGANGIESILSSLPLIDFAIVGEPTGTDLAIAEKGLLVLDCTAHGQAGHAAREEGENAIYKAMKDIEWFRHFNFPRISALLGPVKMSVTSVQTQNTAHNVVPADCTFVVDIRITDDYSHEEVLDTIRKHVQSEIRPRSMRLRSSKIEQDHLAVQAGISLGKKIYGSPTTSDAALMHFPVLKCGPGNSARSHTANEFIFLSEIEEGIKTYIGILSRVLLQDKETDNNKIQYGQIR